MNSLSTFGQRTVIYLLIYGLLYDVHYMRSSVEDILALRGRLYEEAVENYVLSIMNCILHQILLMWSNQGRWVGHVSRMGEKNTS